jgi:hypothetical protein
MAPRSRRTRGSAERAPTPASHAGVFPERTAFSPEGAAFLRGRIALPAPCCNPYDAVGRPDRPQIVFSSNEDLSMVSLRLQVRDEIRKRTALDV